MKYSQNEIRKAIENCWEGWSNESSGIKAIAMMMYNDRYKK